MAGETYQTFGFPERTTITIGSAVADVISIGDFGVSSEVKDATVLGDSVKKSRLSHITDPGTVEITLQHHAAHTTALKALALSKQPSQVIVTIYSDNVTAVETWTWASALVSAFNVTGAGSIDGNCVESKATLVFTSLPTVT